MYGISPNVMGWRLRDGYGSRLDQYHELLSGKSKVG
jgi:hypothetical protein